MAYTAIYANGTTFNMVKKFVVDTFKDVAEIDVQQISPGSTAFVIETSKTYMLNNKYKWIEVQLTGGSSGGGGTTPSGDIIYEGGEI